MNRSFDNQKSSLPISTLAAAVSEQFLEAAVWHAEIAAQYAHEQQQQQQHLQNQRHAHLGHRRVALQERRDNERCAIHMQSLVAEVEAVNRVLTELVGTNGDGGVACATESDGGDRHVGLEGFSDGLASLRSNIVF